MSRTEDLKKLEALLDNEGLDDWETEAFEGMREKLSKNSNYKLTVRQRDKVEQAWEKLEMDAEEGSKNLFSSGKVPAISTIRLPYEDMPRPLKPPGR
jgi:hypothetical protein